MRISRLITLMICCLLLLAACGNLSLDERLTNGSGQWTVMTPEGDQVNFTFYDNGLTLIKNEDQSLDGIIHRVEGNDIQFIVVDDGEEEVVLTFANCEIENNHIHAQMIEDDNQQTSITLTK